MTLATYAWIFNLDAELELWRSGYTRSNKDAARLREHARQASGLVGPNDFLLSESVAASSTDSQAAPDPAKKQLQTQPAAGWHHLESQATAGRKQFGSERAADGPRLMRGRAWCPTSSAVAAFGRAKIEPEPHPTQEVLRRVNHRTFAFELGAGPPGAAVVRSVSELDQLLKRNPRSWRLKRSLGFAGRGQQRVTPPLSVKQWEWVRASLVVDELVAEPEVSPVMEMALHGFIWRDRHYELGRVCVQQVQAGVWQGTRVAQEGEVHQEEQRQLQAAAHRVARALGETAYFGPFGVDAYRYAHDSAQSTPGFVALSEVNARYSMGFAVGFPRHAWALSL